MKPHERFLKYVSFPTMSDEKSTTVPSTKKQLVLGEYLVKELKSIGVCDAELDSKGVVYASIPSNTDKKVPVIGFLAHMDTSDEAADEPIKAKTTLYDGNDICLNEEKDIWLRESDYPNLALYKGQHVITSDGTTLIGADDKAGIAAIVCAAQRLISEKLPHGEIKIAFTPDEEIGTGADSFDVERFGADYAYTVDGGAVGEFEYDNFNAARAEIYISGISIHTGLAKDKMKNAALMACEFNSMLPCCEIPAKTENHEGFFHLAEISGECETARLTYLIRDHDREKFEKRKQLMLEITQSMNSRYGGDFFKAEITDTYYNMKQIIEQHMYIVDNALEAMRDIGMEPKVIPIRGGTDGSKLSYRGLPCPNLCTGGENFHSRFEYISEEALEKVTQLVTKIAVNAVK